MPQSVSIGFMVLGGVLLDRTHGNWNMLLYVMAAVYVAATLTTPSHGAAAIGLRLVWIAVFAGVCVGVYQLKWRARPAVHA